MSAIKTGRWRYMTWGLVAAILILAVVVYFILLIITLLTGPRAIPV